MEKTKGLLIMMGISLMATDSGSTGSGSTGAGSAHHQNSSSVSDQTSSGISEDAPPSPSGNGCSTVPNTCDALCLKIDASGCITCTCSGTEANISSSGLTSGSLTGSAIKLPHSAVMNLNGCPSFPAECPGKCASLDSNGCAICKCPVSGTPGANGTSIAGGDATDGGVNAYYHGCPTFSKDCPVECADVDDRACVVCRCISGTPGANGTSIAGGGGGTTNSTYHNVYNHLPPGSSNINNNCPLFSESCPAECTTSNDDGCPVCSCSVSGSTGGGSTSGGSGTDGQAVVCPPLDITCPTDCMHIGNGGCILCQSDCKGPSTNSSGSSSGAITGNNNVCPIIDYNTCKPECATFDANGCLLCTCTVPATKPATTTNTRTTMSPIHTTRIRLCNDGGHLHPCSYNSG